MLSIKPHLDNYTHHLKNLLTDHWQWIQVSSCVFWQVALTDKIMDCQQNSYFHWTWHLCSTWNAHQPSLQKGQGQMCKLYIQGLLDVLHTFSSHFFNKKKFWEILCQAHVASFSCFLVPKILIRSWSFPQPKRSSVKKGEPSCIGGTRCWCQITLTQRTAFSLSKERVLEIDFYLEVVNIRRYNIILDRYTWLVQWSNYAYLHQTATCTTRYWLQRYNSEKLWIKFQNWNKKTLLGKTVWGESKAENKHSKDDKDSSATRE